MISVIDFLTMESLRERIAVIFIMIKRCRFGLPGAGQMSLSQYFDISVLVCETTTKGIQDLSHVRFELTALTHRDVWCAEQKSSL